MNTVLDRCVLRKPNSPGPMSVSVSEAARLRCWIKGTVESIPVASALERCAHTRLTQRRSDIYLVCPRSDSRCTGSDNAAWRTVCRRDDSSVGNRRGKDRHRRPSRRFFLWVSQLMDRFATPQTDIDLGGVLIGLRAVYRGIGNLDRRSICCRQAGLSKMFANPPLGKQPSTSASGLMVF